MNNFTQIAKRALIPFNLHGKEFDAQLLVMLDRDDTISAEDFESPEDLAAWERGDLESCVITVTATWMEVEGLANLGGCWLTGPDQWQDIVAEHNMIEGAILDLKNKVTEIVNSITGV